MRYGIRLENKNNKNMNIIYGFDTISDSMKFASIMKTKGYKNVELHQMIDNRFVKLQTL